MNNTLVVSNSRINEAEKMDKWRGRQNGGNQCPRTAYRKNDEKQNEDSLRDFWDNIKCTNICIIGILEGEEKERTQKSIGTDNS